MSQVVVNEFLGAVVVPCLVATAANGTGEGQHRLPSCLTLRTIIVRCVKEVSLCIGQNLDGDVVSVRLRRVLQITPFFIFCLPFA